MKRPFSHRLVVVIATGAYLGYIGPAPGTLGSLLGLFLLWPLSPGTTQVLVTLVLIGVGLVVAGRAAKVMGAQDPSAIIIDEIARIGVIHQGLCDIFNQFFQHVRLPSAGAALGWKPSGIPIHEPLTIKRFSGPS